MSSYQKHPVQEANDSMGACGVGLILFAGSLALFARILLWVV